MPNLKNKLYELRKPVYSSHEPIAERNLDLDSFGRERERRRCIILRRRYRRGDITLIRGCDGRRFIRQVPCQVGVSCSSIRLRVPEFRPGGNDITTILRHPPPSPVKLLSRI